MVAQIAEGDDPVYGVNTGFGDLAAVRVAHGDLRALQRNLVRSHAVGVGPALPEDVVRAVLLLRANTLAAGHSGVRTDVVNLLCDMLNRRVHPVIPRHGSVGASGDLAPLAHAALVLIGEGETVAEGKRRPGAESLKAAGLEFDVAMTSGPGDATELARKAVKDSVPTVVAAGGDGTIHEVANAPSIFMLRSRRTSGS